MSFANKMQVFVINANDVMLTRKYGLEFSAADHP